MLKQFTPIPLQVAQETPMGAWYSADNPLSIISSSGRVSEWSDQSGFKRQAIQPMGASEPQTGVETLQGKNVISFVSADNMFFNIPDSIVPDLSSGSVTMFLVGVMSASLVNQYFIGSTTTNRFYLSTNASTDALQMVFGGGTPLILSGSGLATTPFIVMVSVEGTTGTCSFSVNNETPITGTKAFTAPPNVLLMGTRTSGAGNLDGYIAEAIFYQDILSDSNQLNIWNYLSDKWGIALS